MSTHDEFDYEVGYGKPPEATQFRKGRSGNPKGRPKEAKGFNASLKREMESLITVREGDRQIRISKAEAMAKRLAASALKGDPKILMALLKLDAEIFGGIGSDAETGTIALAPEPVDYDILRDHLSEPTTEVDGTIENQEIVDDED